MLRASTPSELVQGDVPLGLGHLINEGGFGHSSVGLLSSLPVIVPLALCHIRSTGPMALPLANGRRRTSSVYRRERRRTLSAKTCQCGSKALLCCCVLIAVIPAQSRKRAGDGCIAGYLKE